MSDIFDDAIEITKECIEEQIKMTPPRPPEGKHSPLPWRYTNSHPQDWVIKSAFTVVARLNNEADAELIVKAVNLHAKLVAALQDALTMIEPKQFPTGVADIKALLKEAKEGR